MFVRCGVQAPHWSAGTKHLKAFFPNATGPSLSLLGTVTVLCLHCGHNPSSLLVAGRCLPVSVPRKEALHPPGLQAARPRPSLPAPASFFQLMHSLHSHTCLSCLPNHFHMPGNPATFDPELTHPDSCPQIALRRIVLIFAKPLESNRQEQR